MTRFKTYMITMFAFICIALGPQKATAEVVMNCAGAFYKYKKSFFLKRFRFEEMALG